MSTVDQFSANDFIRMLLSDSEFEEFLEDELGTYDSRTDTVSPANLRSVEFVRWMRERLRAIEENDESVLVAADLLEAYGLTEISASLRGLIN